ncbi:hypothetical protein ACJMK2_029151 [Sinanodonta woodiana]|uniref:EF-hand domain-containing protein n=1 Tax=Sinanodonta woodiana TaxID=1069815 RepID=A0ABD3XCW5_SINWO
MFSMIIPWFYSVIAHPERPPIPDDPNARHLFQLADMNRTADGYLTEAEVDDIFTQFDIDGDNRVNEAEFVKHWTDLNLGQNVSALVLFTRADTDGDGHISRNPDMGRIFYYFDRDGDHKVSLPEFVTVWYSLSS